MALIQIFRTLIAYILVALVDNALSTGSQLFATSRSLSPNPLVTPITADRLRCYAPLNIYELAYRIEIRWRRASKK